MMDEALSIDEGRNEARMKKTAYVLGLSGLLPFLAGAMLVAVFQSGPLGLPAATAFHYYAVAILSFLGGIRWGYAIRPHSEVLIDAVLPSPLQLVGSVLPSLIAWASLFAPLPIALAVLLIAFAAQGVWDSFAAQAGQLPKWFSPLRMLLTIVVVACHAVVLLSVTFNA